jgi:hypothetical protein
MIAWILQQYLKQRRRQASATDAEQLMEIYFANHRTAHRELSEELWIRLLFWELARKNPEQAGCIIISQ